MFRHWNEPETPKSCKDKTGFLVNLSDSLDKGRISLITEVFAKQNESVVALISTRHILCILDNWFVHAEHALGSQVPVIHIALDPEVQRFCMQRHQSIAMRLTCLDLSGWMPDVDEGNLGNRNSNAGLGSCIYQMIVWTKPLFLMHAANVSKYGVLMVDSDVLMFGNIVHWLQDFKAHRPPTEVLITGQEGRAGWNTGTVFATQASVELLQKWLKVAPMTARSWSADQAGLFQLMDWYDAHSLQCPVATIPKEVVGECGQYSHTNLAAHFNCAHDKIAAMRSARLWQPVAPDCV